MYAKPGGLRGGLRFGIVQAGVFMGDRHAEIVFDGMVIGGRHVDPAFVVDVFGALSPASANVSDGLDLLAYTVSDPRIGSRSSRILSQAL